MSIYDDSVNERLELSRSMIKQINHVKKTTSLEDVQTLVFAGMLSYYGEEHFNDIYMAFLDTNFICSDESILRVVFDKYSDYSSSMIASLYEHELGTFYEVSGFQDKDTKKIKIKRNIYIDKELLKQPDVLVEKLVHHMNHVLNSRKNSICSKQGKLASRMGISLDYLNSRESESLALEESINKLQSREIMDLISGFGCFEIKDNEISRILELMQSDVDSEKKEDDVMTSIVRPLYENDEFNEVLVDRRLSGRLSGIREEFDSKAGEGSYRVFLLSCEAVAKAHTGVGMVNIYEEKAKSLVKKYVEETNTDK